MGLTIWEKGRNMLMGEKSGFHLEHAKYRGSGGIQVVRIGSSPEKATSQTLRCDVEPKVGAQCGQ